uniref:Ectin-like n=1 Tax=Crassostrea virginica TaxID=6565 RepID=A0A8B8D9G3_CRAVI|nr:ectin-like [Crassostrea virginica]
MQNLFPIMAIQVFRILYFVLALKHIKGGYFFGSSTLPWQSARTDCEGRGMRLVSPENQAMYEAAVSFLQNNIGSLNEEVWIGVHTLSTSSPYVYQYVDGKMADFFDWNHDEPDKQDTDFCIRLYKSNLLYGTWDCGNKAQYLCEDVNGAWSGWTCGPLAVPPAGRAPSLVPDSVTPLPLPQEGELCGSDAETKPCTLIECPVNGMWSVWMEWSECIQVQCGVVNRTRSRSCDSPPPSLGGSYCVGTVEETESCVNTSCPSGERWTCFEFEQLSSQSLQEKTEEISRNLTVNTTTLSSTVRKKTCAEDPRPSSKYIGAVAALIIGMYFALLLFVDLISFIGWTLRKCT